mgnify:FL=1|tara:strand:+ start:594 stop:1097 length:504 start_codon:yes stop_codon:yes gene_type:complete
MAWNIDLVLMLRSLIGDLDKSKYTNERLKQIITIAAYNVNNASSFINTYTIDVGEISISPDPLANDPDFCSLTVYKSACILLGSEVKTESANAISIKDGPSAIDLRGVSGSLSIMYKDFCQKYDEMLTKYIYEKGSGSGAPTGAAVLSPYSPASWGVGYNDGGQRNF